MHLTVVKVAVLLATLLTVRNMSDAILGCVISREERKAPLNHSYALGHGILFATSFI